jgi:DNA-binding transcriptional regulator LsrR (DeoR family)
MLSKRDLDLLKAAYYSVYDPVLTQDQIASRVGLTQVQVSRYLKEAREKKYLWEAFRVPPGLSPEDLLEIVNSFFPRHGELEEALSTRSRQLSRKQSGFGSPFKQLYVVAAPGIANEKDAVARGNAFRSFGMSAAGIVASYIDGVDTCCVAWGRTIATTVDFMPNSSASNGKKQFIPIAGEPTNHEPNGIAPSDAAQRLSQAWPPDSTSLSLRGVPARIPKSVHDQDGGEIARKLVGYSNNYRQIFGTPDSDETPLISEVPMILKYDHFKGCALNADLQQRRPGVVVVAVERAKADIILETLHLINVLIVSRELADELANRLLKG